MRIKHAFVLMLENRSFDQMFAPSGISRINVPTLADTNSFDRQTYAFQGGAPDQLPSDPLHDFGSVLQQPSGKSDCTNATPNSARNDSGFVANLSTTPVPHDLFGKQPLPPADYDMIMQGIETARQAPPGTTWPVVTSQNIRSSSLPMATWCSTPIAAARRSIRWTAWRAETG
jgi:phospholipase C